jgi:hypothetical protein
MAHLCQWLLALVDQLVQDPLPRIQVRVPDPVGVPGVELLALGASGRR